MKNKKAGKRFLVSLAVAACLSGGLAGCSKKSTEEHLDAARQFVSVNDQDAAVIEYKNAIKTNPKAALPRFELGKLYLQMGDYPGAEKELNRALDAGQPAPEVIPLLSLAYQKTGAENALADVDYRMDGMTAVESAEVGFYKMQALAQLGKDNEARAIIDDLETLDTSSVYRGLAITYRDILNQDIDKAIESLKTLRVQAPQNKDVLLQLGKLSLSIGDKKTAIDVYEDYVEHNPEDLTSRFAYISLLVEAGRTEEADPLVDSLLASNPQHPLLNQFKGIIEANAGEYEKAIEHLQTAINGGQDNPALKLITGYAAYQMQDYASANTYLAQVVPSLPDDHPALKLYADSLLQLGQGEVASQVLNRVDSDSTGDASLFSKAGYQLLKQGNIVDAKAMIERSSETSERAIDLARLGLLQLSVNDVDGLVNIEAAAAKAPESISTQRTLISAYMSTGHFDKAMSTAQDWADKEPDNHVPHLYLAEIAYKSGDKAQTMAEIEKATTLQPDAVDTDLVRARLLLSESKISEAVTVLNQALEKAPANEPALSMLYAVATVNDNVDAEEVEQRVFAQLSQNADNTPLRLLGARIAFTKGDFNETLNLLEPIQPSMETPTLYWNLKGQALIRKNDLLGAAGHYQQWLSFFPQDKTAVLGMLTLLDAQQKYREGLDLTNQFLSKRPDSQVLLLKAHFLALTQQPKPARAILDSLPENVSTLPVVRSIEARVKLLEGKGLAALDDAMAAYNAKPNSKAATLVVATYESGGEGEKAMAFINEHLAKFPNDTLVAMMQAERLIGRDKDAAKKAYNAIIERSPNNFVVLNNLAYLYYEDGELDKAATLARKAVGLQPKNADSVDTLAQILAQQDKYEEALSLYDSVMEEGQVSDTVYLNYVQVLLDMGRKEIARQKLGNKTFTSPQGNKRAERMRARYSL
ncbi:XrtA/PEP-CTERM system TPR-repeat protein PrsT [Alteromonas sp. C1M14]|uniref:XrtA/PEP-CTERM system TPR-repeat protein PrsT n=1 Tax=Alteromonas sp. C1M14 TaxID=2841567 RepID=UPI001C087964|nr:XrtA/PEP-CTERM system TPR-repeat protein PrsT [Alteromonas sp. C1M14]MBU2977553.1 PEP-CTERM system TPR-repeat protein PrsT [Alteromonas sp. C1M14]